MFASITDSLPFRLPLTALAALAFSVTYLAHSALLSRRRARKIPSASERVLIVGASSGIGRAIAHEYAARGARICATARRKEELTRVVEECIALSPPRSGGTSGMVFSVAADFTNVEDMVRLRDAVEFEWSGLDTMIVCAGASTLRPLMEVAGLERHGREFTPAQANVEGIQRTVLVANTASRINYIGPLVSAVTFLPLLQASSVSPSILLISSLAAVIPPPTRSLYASTKAASLMLYQVLSIEHSEVTFSLVIPATVQGDFRASAVDGGEVREVNPAKHGLRPEDVAKRCVRAVDAGDKFVFLPYVYGKFGHLLYWLLPAFVEWRARVKYNFAA